MEITKQMYWELVELLNQWRENDRKIKCKNCKNKNCSKKVGN